MNTSDIELRLTAYADGELDDAEAAEIEAYLAENPDARAFVDTQKAVRSALNAKMSDGRAPEYLRRRVLDSVRSESPGLLATLRGWLGSFRLGPAASVALVTATVVALVIASGSFSDRSPNLGVDQSVTLVGEVQCIDCAAAHRWGVDSECDVYGHRNGVVLSDGTMWTVKHSDEWTPEHLRDTTMWGKQITLTGHRYGAAHYIDVESFSVEEPALTEADDSTAAGEHVVAATR